MAFIRDPKLIFDKMKQEGLAFWTLFDSDKKSIIDEIDTEEADPSESLDRLQDLIYSLDGLIYVVLRTTNKRVRAAGGDMKGTYQYSLRLGSSSSGINGHTDRGNAYGNPLKEMMTLMEQRHAAELKALEARLTLNETIKDLQRQIKEKNAPDATDKLLEQVANMFMQSNSGIMKPTALAGPGENPEPAQTEQQISREEAKLKLSQAIQRLYKIDPTFHETLTKLADLAENTPAKYQMALTML